MRKVKITKQQTVNPKAVYMGLSKSQIIIMILGLALAIAIFYLFFFCWNINVNITMTIIFIELLVFSGLSVIRVNGLNLFKWLRVVFASPIHRPYQSKGMLDTYEKEKERK